MADENKDNDGIEEDQIESSLSTRLDDMSASIRELQNRLSAIEESLANRPPRKTHLKAILGTILLVAMVGSVLAGAIIYGREVGLF